jgi:hypothetical protein
MSFATALAQGKPVVFTDKDGIGIPEVVVPKDTEKAALELLEELGLIKITRFKKETPK